MTKIWDRALPPWFGQNPKEQQLFFGMLSLRVVRMIRLVREKKVIFIRVTSEFEITTVNLTAKGTSRFWHSSILVLKSIGEKHSKDLLYSPKLLKTMICDSFQEKSSWIQRYPQLLHGGVLLLATHPLNTPLPILGAYTPSQAKGNLTEETEIKLPGACAMRIYYSRKLLIFPQKRYFALSWTLSGGFI